MEWDAAQSLLLIDLYHDKPVLWDVKNSNHSNKIIKTEAWAEIAEAQNISVDDCKRKMTSLLSSYRRERAKLNNSQAPGKGPEDLYKSTWFAYKAFDFLAKPRSRKACPIKREEIEPDRGSSPPFLKRDSTIFIDRISKRHKPAEDPLADIADIPKTSNDESGNFANFVGHKMRRYTDTTRNIVQFKISEIIFNADQGQYDSYNSKNRRAASSDLSS